MVWEWGFEGRVVDEDLEPSGATEGLLGREGVAGEVDEARDEGSGKSAGRKRCGTNRFGLGNCRGERQRTWWATQRSWEVRG